MKSLTILLAATAFIAAPAWADNGHRGGHEFHGHDFHGRNDFHGGGFRDHDRFSLGFGLGGYPYSYSYPTYSYPSYSYSPSCGYYANGYYYPCPSYSYSSPYYSPY